MPKTPKLCQEKKETARLKRALQKCSEYRSKEKQIKDDLYLQNARFTAIYENSPVAVLLVDLTGHFVSVNKSASKMLGYSDAELKKKTFGDITHPDERERDIAKIKEMVSGKLGVYKVDKHYIRKDKKVISVHIEATLIRDDAKKPLYFLTVAEDITERKRLEEELIHSRLLYSSLVEGSNDGVVILQDNLIKFFNRKMSEMIGFSDMEVYNKPFLNFVTDKYKKETQKRFDLRNAGNNINPRYEIDMLKKNGPSFTVEINASLINFENRWAVMYVVRDMTSAKEIDRMKSEFVSMASHQLSTPLTGIKWSVETLLKNDQKNLSSEQLETIKKIDECNKRMLDLVSDLLDISHIESGRKFSIEMKKEDMVDIVKEEIEEQWLDLKKKGIKLQRCSNSPKHLYLSVDRKKIGQVFHNLFNNRLFPAVLPQGTLKGKV